MPVRSVVSVESSNIPAEGVARLTGMAGAMFLTARDRHLEKVRSMLL